MADKQKPSGGQKNPKGIRSRVGHFIWRGSRWRRALVLLLAIVVSWSFISYGVALWYKEKHDNEPLIIGTTFISDYAKSFNL